MLDRYRTTTPDQRRFDLVHIAGSKADTAARAIFRLHHGAGDLALKLDLEGGANGRPGREYAALKRLGTAFDATAETALIQPVWLDPEGIGLVTRYVSGPTALRAATDDPSPENLAVLGREGARFLNILHGAGTCQEAGYWPDWVCRRLTALSGRAGVQAPEIGASACNRLIDAYRRASAPHRGASCIKTLTHGDFHGGNLIISDGVSTGLDVTDIGDKLGLYDVVDYLTSLDLQRPGSDGPMTDLGLDPALDRAFTESYQHPLARAPLRCAMLGKWLILAFKITKVHHTASRFQQVKLTRLLARIAHIT